MDGRSDQPVEGRPASVVPPPAAPAEPRQRWRIVVARDPVASDQVGRAALDAWHATLVASGLPVAGLEVPDGRPRLAFAAPLAAAASGAAELVDLWLLERIPLWRLREALTPVLPTGFHWVAAEDIWLGAPALPGQVAAADWAVTLEVAGDASSSGAGDARGEEAPRTGGALRAAAAALMRADSIPRTRGKPGAEKPYDLRPLVVSIDIGDAGAQGDRTVVVRMRTRLDPERGTGRPEEVVGALAAVAGIEVRIVELVRLRLILAADLRD